jgi:hypothetical protein
MFLSKLMNVAVVLCVIATVPVSRGLLRQPQAAASQKAQAAATNHGREKQNAAEKPATTTDIGHETKPAAEQPKAVTTPKEGRIFFVRQKGVGQAGFAMVNPDGTEETSLKGTGFHAVSPDGKAVAYGVPVQEENSDKYEVGVFFNFPPVSQKRA